MNGRDCSWCQARSGKKETAGFGFTWRNKLYWKIKEIYLGKRHGFYRAKEKGVKRWLCDCGKM